MWFTSRVWVSASLLAVSLFAVPASGGVVTWTAGSGTDFDWGTVANANWDTVPSSGPTLPTASDDVLFDTPIPNPGFLPNPEIITLSTGSAAKSLEFKDSYTLSGGDLTLTSGNVTADPTYTATINSALIGSGGLNKLGAGTLVLGGTNAFSGAVNVSNGVLSFSTGNNLGDGSTTNTLSIDGGTLEWTGGSAQSLGTNRTVAIGAGGATFNTTGGGALTIDGVISGTGGLTKQGSGTLVLSAANTTFSGPVDIAGGMLSVGASNNLGDGSATNSLTLSGGGTLRATGSFDFGTDRTFTVGSGGGTLDFGANNLTFSGALTSGAGNNLAKTGSGTLTLSGSSANTNAGLVSIAQGTLALSKTGGVNAIGAGGVEIKTNGGAGTLRLDAAEQIDDTATVYVNANVGGQGALFNLNGQNETVGALYLRTVTNAGAVVQTGATGVLTVNGDITFDQDRGADNSGAARYMLITGTGTVGTAAPSGTLDLGSATRTITVNYVNANQAYANGADATIETAIRNGGIIKAGNRTLYLRNTNTFSGGLKVDAGLVDFDADDRLGSAGNILTLNGGGLRYNAGSALTLTRTLNITAGVAEIGVAQTGGPLTFNTADLIKSTGATTITKSGSGTLNLNAANPNLNASWKVTGGTLAVSDFAALGTLAPPDVTLAGGTARFNVVNPTVATPGINGLNAYFYNVGTGIGSTNNNAFAADQLLPGRVLTRVDTHPDMLNMPTSTYPRDAVSGFQVPDNLAMMWKGLLNVTTEGDYTFRMVHDDNAALYIDGQIVLADAAYTGSTAWRSATIPLTSGAHSIVLKLTQGGGGKYLIAQYAGADTGGATTFEVIGSTAGTLTTGSLAPVAYGTVGGGGTWEIYAPWTANGFTLANGETFTLSSPTIDDLTITGTATLDTAGTGGTLAPTTGALIFNTGIGEATWGSKLTIAGPYLTQFNAANSYTGVTTVTGGRLELNAGGGNSIAGDLDINAANSGGLFANVQLKQANQIADGATVTVRNASILDLGANNETIYRLDVQDRGAILGSGTLTTSSIYATSGAVMANLAGTGGLTKNGLGTLVLGGTNTYTGVTYVYGGSLSLRGNSLGATGSDNETIVWYDAQIQLLGGLTSAEPIALLSNGTGDCKLYNVNGVNTLSGGVSLDYDATFRSDAGNLVFAGGIAPSLPDWYSPNLVLTGAGDFTVNGAVNLGTSPPGTLTKNGSGALVFAYNVGSTIPTMAWNAGVLGFKGTQSLGTKTVGVDGPGAAAGTWRFDSDPGAGNTIIVPAGKGLIGNFNVNQAFLGRIDGSSAGFLALGQTNANDLDFTSHPSLSLGATTWVDYTGTITPGVSGYRLGGGGGELRVRSVLSGNNPLTVSGAGVVYLHDSVVNTFTGNVTVDGGTLRIAENDSLGAGSNTVTLTNGGKLTLIQNTSNTGSLFGMLGNAIGQGTRQIIVGSGGCTISVESYNNLGNAYALVGNNPLTGSGTLTKTDFGTLYLLNSAAFSGSLVVTGQGGSLEVRSQGALPNIAGIELNANGYLIVDNHNSLGSRQYSTVNNNDRINDSAPINMRGGLIYYKAKNASGQTSETFGAVTLTRDQNVIRLERNGQGADVTLADLIRTTGGGTVRFENNAGAFGGTGNNPRLKFTLLNGATPSTTNLIGGWAMISNNGTFEWAGYDATNGVVQSAYTAVTNTTFTPTASNVVNLNTAGTATLSGSASMLALRYGVNNADQTLAFTNGTDVLNIVSGGVIGITTDNNNRSRNIGSSTTRGVLTAGSIGATGTQELFFRLSNRGDGQTGNIFTVYSTIVDNDSAPVALVKDLAGTLQLDGANTYSGGTLLYGGRINVLSSYGLGYGPVLVKGAALELRATNATSDISGIIARDQSEIYLNANIAFNGYGDRFIIEPGSTITSNTTNSNRLASLTRVSTLTGGGQVVLYPEAIIRSTDSPQGDVMTYMIKNLGTDADLYYNQSGGFEQNQFITVGAGTPWKGLSSSVSEGWHTGTILANSDFWLQGLARIGTNVTLNIGRASTQSNPTGSWAVVNQSGQPINAYVTGAVALNEDTPVNLPNDLTFVVTKDGLLQPNYASSFGDLEYYGTRASVLVKAGGTLDPGNYAPINPYGDAATYGKQYGLYSPVNTNLVVESAGRFLINDASGIGSVTGGATWTMKTGSILQLDHANAFFGSQNGLVASSGSPFSFEPGAIVRIYSDNRIYKLDQFVSGATGGAGVIYEISNGDRNLTEYVDPFLVPATGTPRIFGHDLTIGAGGGITNDVSDRTVRNRRGTVYLDDGATLSATTQTYLYMQQNFEILPNATVTIGSAQFIDGLPKLGTVSFNRENNNVGDNTTKLTLTDGTQLMVEQINVIPDATSVHLPTVPTSANLPSSGPGTALVLNSNGNTEFIGKLTGNGYVFSGQDTTGIGAGWDATSDFTFDGVISDMGKAGNANRNDPRFLKVGPTKMTMTNTHTSAGDLYILQGELAFAGPDGKWTGGNLRVGKGATLTFDNTANAVTNRYLNTGGYLTAVGGGAFRLLGHATDVGDVYISQLANSTTVSVPSYQGGNPGGFGTITVVPSGDLSTLRTSLTFNQFQRFDNTGDRSSVWLFRGIGVGGLPGTYDASGVYTPNAANPQDGLIFANSPRFTGNGGFDFNTGVIGGPGTPVVPVRGDLLASADPDATQGEFATIDIPSGASRTGVRPLTAAEYSDVGPAVGTNRTLAMNVRAPAATALNYSGDSRFQVLKMENGSSLNVAGTLPHLTQGSQVVLNGGGILVPAGATASITTAAGSVFRTASGVSAYVHAYGNLNVNGEFFSDIGLVKTGAGTASFAAGSLTNLRTHLVVHEGTLSINDSLATVHGNVTSAAAFVGSHLGLNGGTLDLNGTSQLFGRFESGNILAGTATEGGTLHSTAPATVAMTEGGTFSGHITGAISLRKFANNTLILTNANSMTGTVRVEQGTFILRDSGTLANVSQVDINYARLDLDNGWLAGVGTRINPAAIINMRGGDFLVRGRAGEKITTNLGTVNVNAGTNLFQSIAGGGGATELVIGNLVRSQGSFVSFVQNNGYMGTPGDDSTAIRYKLASLNGGPVSLTNNILPAYIIANNDHFATYDPVLGVSYLSNTEDGFATYDNTNLSTASSSTGSQNFNDGSSRTIPAGAVVNSIRNAGGATFTLSGSLTINSGGLLTNVNSAVTYTGASSSITSGTSELYLWTQQNTTTYNTKITGNISVLEGGSGTIKFQGPGNDYTGTTYALGGSSGQSGRSGVFQLDVTGANGTTIVAVPGDLWIGNTLVSELKANQISQDATITLEGGGGLDLVNAASTTETFKAFVFLNSGGDAHPRAIVSRSAQQTTSTVALTGATPITATNDNPVSTPAFGQNLGKIAFAGADGSPQTLMINSPVSPNGFSAAGFILNGGIVDVPAGVDDGGLVKDGTGLLIMGGNVASTFGNPGTPTEVFNIKTGYVRIDSNDALGPNNAITTVQDGAVLLFNGSTVNGSLQLKDGATIGVTLNNTTLGAVPSAGTVDVPSGATVAAQVRDYFAPGDTTRNIVINHKLTGGGTINLVGIEYAAGYNGGGLFQLRNTYNDFAGTINVGTNAVLEANSNTGTGGTFGTAIVNLNGGVLRVREDNDVIYGNNVFLNVDSLIDVDRQNAPNVSRTIDFGTLTVAAGSRVLNTAYSSGAPNPDPNKFGVTGDNNYRVGFASVDGVGTLVKGGTRIVNLNGYAPTFSGNIEIAGPRGASLSASGSLMLNAASNSLNNLTVNGFHTMLAGKTVAIANVLEVGNNAGAVGNGLGFNGTSYVPVSNGAISGALLIESGAGVTAATLRNQGVVGPTGGAATVNATTIVGGGIYNAYGNDLTLNGTIANDGATPTTLRVAGTSAVVLTTVGHTFTGGVRVESGALRVAPPTSAVDPLPTSGVIRTFGQPVTAVGPDTQAVNQAVGTLEFAAGANTITQNGTIVNNGAIRASSGTVNLPGGIAGTIYASLTNPADFLAATVPGLTEGVITGSGSLDTSATRPGNQGQFGVTSEVRMGQTNLVTQNVLTGWTDNNAWVYTGYFYDADGIFTFAENIDDRVLISIDGVTRLYNANNNITSTATKSGQRGTTQAANANTANVGDLVPISGSGIAANPNLPAGWHTIEIRLHNGVGGAGPWGTSNGFTTNYAFGFNPDGTMTLDGTQFFRPIDDGSGNLFRTAVYGKGNVQVDAGATLNVSQVTLTNRMTLAADAAGGTINLNAGSPAASAVDHLEVTGSTGTATLTTNANTSLTVGNFSGAPGTTLTHNAPVSRLVITGDAALGTIDSTGTAGVTFDSSAAQFSSSVIAGNGGLIKQGSGVLTLGATNTYDGATLISAGTVRLANGLPGASVWLDASDLTTITADGLGKVSQWNDKSGNDRHAVQATGANQPTSTTNALVGGKSIMQMDGTATFMDLDLTPLANSSYTIIALEGRTSNKTNNYLLGTGTNTNNTSLHFGYRTDAQVTLAQYGNDLNGTVPGYVSQQFSILVGTLDTASGHALYRDGVLLNSNTNTTPFISANLGVVGRGNNADAARYYAGDLGEVLIYPYALSPAEVQFVTDWLTAKWLGSGGSGEYIPDASPVSIAAGSTLDLNSVSETIGSLSSASATAAVTLGSATLTTGGNGDTTDYAGSITGTGNLVKDGAGTMTISGADGNNYTGNTLVIDGILQVNYGVNSNDTASGTTTVGTDTTTATLITEHIRQNALIINAGSKVEIATLVTPGASAVSFVEVADGSGGGGFVPPSGSASVGVTPVPEPATWLLVVMAAVAGLIAWRRR